MTATADPEAVGRVVRSRREEIGYSIQELAQKAEISRNTLGQIERGSRTCTGATLAKVARALGTSGAQIIAESEGRDEDPDFYNSLKEHLQTTVSKIQIPSNMRALIALAEQLLYLETKWNGELTPAIYTDQDEDTEEKD